MVLYVVDAFIFGTGHTRFDEFDSGRIFVKVEEYYVALESNRVFHHIIFYPQVNPRNVA